MQHHITLVLDQDNTFTLLFLASSCQNNCTGKIVIYNMFIKYMIFKHINILVNKKPNIFRRGGNFNSKTILNCCLLQAADVRTMSSIAMSLFQLLPLIASNVSCMMNPQQDTISKLISQNVLNNHTNLPMN